MAAAEQALAPDAATQPQDRSDFKIWIRPKVFPIYSGGAGEAQPIMQQECLMVSIRQVQPVLMSRDVEASIRFYAKLGFKVVFRDDPDRVRYAGVRRDGIDLHLQWHDAKEWDFPNDRPTYRFLVDDVDRLCAEFRERGILTDITDVRDTPWGTREFHVRDPDRNGLQFYRDL